MKTTLDCKQPHNNGDKCSDVQSWLTQCPSATTTTTTTAVLNEAPLDIRERVEDEAVVVRNVTDPRDKVVFYPRVEDEKVATSVKKVNRVQDEKVGDIEINRNRQLSQNSWEGSIPDVVSSSDTDPRTILFDDEVITFGENDAYDPNKANRIRYKWRAERHKHIDTERKLRSLIDMTSEQLREYYINMKKDKLQWRIRVQKSQRQLDLLNLETGEIEKKVNSKLSCI